MKKTSKTPTKTWSGLASALGFSRVSIGQWRKLPDAPATPDLGKWQEFIAENGLGIAGNRVGPERERLLAENLRHRNELLRLDLAARQRIMVERASVERLLMHVATQQKAVLFAALEREFPGKCVGRTAAEISMLGRELGDRLCLIFQREIENWTDEAQAPPEAS